MGNKIIKNHNLKQEYQTFITSYLLPLLGWTEETIEKLEFQDEKIEFPKDKWDYIFYDSEKHRLFFGAHEQWLFYLNDIVNIEEEDMKLCKNIIRIFIRLAKNGKSGERILLKSDLYDEHNYRFAIELGLCSWMAGEMPKNGMFPLAQLVNLLKQWAEKTYEGHRVCFGLLFDPENNTRESEYGCYGSFLDFLKSDYSAVLSDGITSIIELDKNCEFFQYHSLTENDKIAGGDLSNHLPYRFACIIEKYVTGSKVGIFLLSNGDIILAKKQNIYFIRRNARWLNFKSKSFYLTLKNYIPEHSLLNDNLVNQIFATALDVSLSHTGGIIAVVDKQRMDELEKIVDPVDLFIHKYLDFQNLEQAIQEKMERNLKALEITDLKLIEIRRKKIKEDTHNRLLKRGIIKALLTCQTSSSSLPNFQVIDRKLRAELIGLDGACIINLEGESYSFGAIIQNESGSTGGGRGAAAKSLSKLGGFAIKISTDGYIEVYVNGDTIYSIK